MSKVHNLLSQEAQPEQRWYLRIPGGVVYGPVELSVLCKWAAQSRIVPGNEISTDKENWRLAETLPDLKMEWMAEMSNNRKFGPFNILAVPGLVKSGALEADARLVNKITNKTITVHEILQSPKPIKAPAHNFRQEKVEKREPPHQIQPADKSLKEKQDPSEVKPEEHKDQEEKTKSELKREKSLRKEIELHAKQVETGQKEKIKRLQRDLRKKDSELNTRGKQYETLKKESILEREKLRYQIEQFKEESSTANIELNRVKKQLDSQQSLLSETEQVSVGKETALMREAQTARTTMTDMESRITESNKEIELLKEKSRNKETELLQRIGRFKRALEESGIKLEQIKSEAAGRETKLSGLIQEHGIKEHELNQQIEQLKKTRDVVELELEGARQESSEQNATIEVLRRKLHEKEQRFALLVEDSEKEAVVRKEQYESVLNSGNEQQKKLNEQLVELNKKLVEKESSIRMLDGELNEGRRLLAEAEARFSNEKAEHQSESEHLKRTLTAVEEGFETASEKLKTRDSEYMDKAARLEQQLTFETQLLAQVQKDYDEKLRSKEASWETQKDELAHKIDELKTKIQKTNQEFERQWADARNQEQENAKAKLEQERKFLNLEEEHATVVTALEKTKEDLKAREAMIGKTREIYTVEKRKLTTDLEAVSAEAAGLNSKLADKSKEHDFLKDQSDNRGKDLKQLQAESKKDAKTIEHLEGDLAKRKVEYEALEKRACDMAGEYERAEFDLKKLRKEYEPLLKKAQKREKELLNKIVKLEVGKGERVKPRSSLLRLVDNIRPYVVEVIKFYQRSPRYIWAGIAVVLLVLFFAVVMSKGNRRAQTAAKRAETISAEKEIVVAESVLSSVIPVEEENKPSATRTEARHAEEQELRLDLAPISLSVEKKDTRQIVQWPSIDVDRVRVNYSERTCTMVFEFGLFSYMTHFAPETEKILGQIASQLRNHMKDFLLIIEGHTDTVPVSSSASFADNDTLALARAKKVLNLLKTRFNMPEKSMKPVSAGEQKAPYSNDDKDLRKKNRTVVLKLIRQ
ncbi:OmpA family protein [Verrucomicrobiota bacterium]